MDFPIEFPLISQGFPKEFLRLLRLEERFALRREADPAELLALLSWLSWSKVTPAGWDDRY
jgi:hypothetical protein